MAMQSVQASSNPSRIPAWAWAAAGAAVGVAALGGAALAAYAFEAGRRGASTWLHPHPKQRRESPRDYDLQAQDVIISTADGLDLQAWYVPGPRPGGPAIAMFHGYSAARSQALPYAKFLSQHYACLMLDFRAAGDSPGKWSTMGTLEAQDVRASFDWLLARGHGRLGVWAMSAGGAAALRVVVDEPRVHAMVMDCPFDHIHHVTAKRASDLGYPLPDMVARAIVREAERRVGQTLLVPAPIDLVGQFAPRPLLIFHGDADETSVVANGRAMYAAAGEPRELIVVPGAGHTAAWRVARELYEARVVAHFQAAL